MLITYLNKPELKDAFLAEIGKHEKLDAIIRGSYGQMNGHFTGCAIGCSLYSLSVLRGKTPQEAATNISDHRRYEAELGWPTWLAYYEDSIFEHLPAELSKTWPRRIAEAVPVGISIPDTVLAKLQAWWLIHERFGVVNATDDAELKAIIMTSGDLFRQIGDGIDAPEAAKEQAAWDARTAWWDAWAARTARAGDARTARAARAARTAWAARAGDARTAWAARTVWTAWAARTACLNADSLASVATRDAFYPALSEYLLSLLRDLR